MSSVPRVSGSSVSGISILLTTIPAGAAMMLAARRCPAIPGNTPTRIATYAASAPPATVANPPVMTVLSSDIVIRSTKGRMRRGASVWPTKMLPAAEVVSAPLVPRVRCIAQATPRTTRCMNPR